jgi:hypothetical protein
MSLLLLCLVYCHLPPQFLLNTLFSAFMSTLPASVGGFEASDGLVAAAEAAAAADDGLGAATAATLAGARAGAGGRSSAAGADLLAGCCRTAGSDGSLGAGNRIDAADFRPPNADAPPTANKSNARGSASSAAPPTNTTGATFRATNVAGPFSFRHAVVTRFFIPASTSLLTMGGHVRFFRHDLGMPAAGLANPRSITTAAICGSIASTSSVVYPNSSSSTRRIRCVTMI